MANAGDYTINAAEDLFIYATGEITIGNANSSIIFDTSIAAKYQTAVATDPVAISTGTTCFHTTGSPGTGYTINAPGSLSPGYILMIHNAADQVATFATYTITASGGGGTFFYTGTSWLRVGTT